MTNSAVPTTVYLKDYAVPPFLISEVALDFDLVSEEDARVRATLTVKRNAQFLNATAPLQLDADELNLESVVIDGVPLASDQYILDARHLNIPSVQDAFRLETVALLNPKQNTIKARSGSRSTANR